MEAEWRIDCVGNLINMGSDKGLSPDMRQAKNIWTNAEKFPIGPFGINFNEIFIKVSTFLFKKIHLKMSANGVYFVAASMC